jgi:hypothetical protein
MRIAVIADVHGNAPALEAVRADIARRNVERIVNLGDCVSGPLWPRETVEALITAQWPTVRGNHDRCVGEDPPEPLVCRMLMPTKPLMRPNACGYGRCPRASTSAMARSPSTPAPAPRTMGAPIGRTRCAPASCRPGAELRSPQNP